MRDGYEEGTDAPLERARTDRMHAAGARAREGNGHLEVRALEEGPGRDGEGEWIAPPMRAVRTGWRDARRTRTGRRIATRRPRAEEEVEEDGHDALLSRREVPRAHGASGQVQRH